MTAPMGTMDAFLVPGPSGARSSAPGRCTDSAAGFASWMWRWSKQNESDCKGTSASWYQIMLSKVWLLQCGFLLATVLLKLKAQHNPRQHNRSHKVYDLILILSICTNGILQNHAGNWKYNSVSPIIYSTMHRGSPEKPPGARCLGDHLVGSIPQGLWQHRLSYLSSGESWILQLMKHDETWHLQTYRYYKSPMGIMWLGDFWIPFGLHQLLQFWCWPCSVLATLGCRLAAARPGDWLESTKGLSTLVISVSAARWSVWVSLSSLCNRDSRNNFNFQHRPLFLQSHLWDIEWNRTNIGVLPTS